MSRWQWLMSRLGKQLWVRTSAIGVMGILIAVLSAVIERYLPWELSGEVSREAVDSLLSILASSMLAVTTFSLSIMVSAYGSATNTARLDQVPSYHGRRVPSPALFTRPPSPCRFPCSSPRTPRKRLVELSVGNANKDTS